MTPLDLLKPRWKVIADYPGNGFKVGDILPDCWNRKEFPEAIIEHSLVEVPKYPHLFRPLSWWEDRSPEDMPGYVKFEKELVVHKARDWKKIRGSLQFEATPAYQKISGSGWNIKNELFLCGSLPATEEEYNAFITTK